MYKRGQVTIFVILGIVVVAVLAWVFFIGGLTFEEELGQEEAERFVSARIEPVKTFVENCVEENSYDVLRNMGRQGGRVIPNAQYYDVPLVIPSSSLMDYNLIKLNGNFVNYNPSLSAMEAEFESFLNDISADPSYPNGIGNCINGLSVFKDSFSDIKTKDMEIDVQFKDKILIFIKYPVTLRKSSYETTIEDYFVEIPIDMGEIHEVTNRLINNIVLDGQYLDVVSSISQEYEKELNANFRKDFIVVDSHHYLIDAVAEFNNRNNILFILEYNNPELTEEYIFRFLTGTG